jgi:heptosyltransferase-3
MKIIEPRRALFIQLRRIGDVLMCTPAVRAFRKRYPDCRLDFLTELPEVLRGNPYLDSIITVERSRQYDPVYQFSLIRKIRSAGYDLVVDFFANPRSAYYSFLSGAATRLSYGFGHRKWAYNLRPEKSQTPCYAARDRLNLLGHIGVDPDGLKLDFCPSDNDRSRAGEILNRYAGRFLVSVSPVSRRDFNRWPLENYAELSRRLSSEYDLSMVILAGPGEEHVADRLAGMLGSIDPIVPRVESLDLLGSLLERMSLHIGNDNGPKHIAVAAGIPTFTIYGPHSPISWTFPEPARHRFIKPADVSPECRRLNHRCDKNCIAKISPDAVWERLQPMVGELSSPASTIENR